MTPDISIANQKETLRKAARITRDSLSRHVTIAWSEQAIGRLTRLPIFAKAETIYTYVSVKNELRTRELIEQLWEQGRRVTVPGLNATGNFEVYQITDWNELTIDSYGRATPVDATPYTSPIDINIVPGIAFTESGSRLGSGYGHYDRFMAAHPDTIHIGLAYEIQLLPSIPQEPHDQPLDYIVTQDRVIRVI